MLYLHGKESQLYRRLCSKGKMGGCQVLRCQVSGWLIKEGVLIWQGKDVALRTRSLIGTLRVQRGREHSGTGRRMAKACFERWDVGGA